MRGPRETIDAAMLATAVRVHRLAEADVGRIVAADDAARAFLGDLGVQLRQRIGLAFDVRMVVDRAPAIVLAAAHGLLIAPGHVRGGAATLDRALSLACILVCPCVDGVPVESVLIEGMTAGGMPVTACNSMRVACIVHRRSLR